MIMILDCFSQKRICSEKYWFKELIILLFHSFFFPFSSEPLWKLLQSDHLQPALLPFFLLSLSLSIVYAVTVYQSIGSMHLKGKLAFFHQLPCQYKWNFSPKKIDYSKRQFYHQCEVCRSNLLLHSPHLPIPIYQPIIDSMILHVI